MNRHRSRLAGLVAAGIAFLAATSPGAEPPDDVDRMLEASGVWLQLAQIEPSIRKSIDEALASRSGTLGAVRTEALHRAIHSAYSPSELRPIVRRRVHTLFPPQHLEQTLHWLDSAAGRRLTAAEVLAAAPEQEARATAEGPAILQQSTAERRALLDRVMRAVHAVESTADLSLHVARGMLRGIAAAAPEAALDPAAIESQITGIRPQTIAQLAPVVAASFAYMYREVADADLLAFATFAESPSGQRYHAVTTDAVHTAFAERSKLLGEFFVSELRQ